MGLANPRRGSGQHLSEFRLINYGFLSALDVNVEDILLKMKMKVSGTNTMMFKFKSTFSATNMV